MGVFMIDPLSYASLVGVTCWWGHTKWVTSTSEHTKYRPK